MFTTMKPRLPWSTVGLRVLIGSIIAAVAFALLDGIIKGPVGMAHVGDSSHGGLIMIATWVVDFRYLAEQAVYAATIFWIGAKFIEMRTVFTIGFDRQDTARITLKGPDDDNVVWIGHRYGTRIEAETVAAAFAERLKESAA
jgi:hypothetical protein